LVLHFKNAEIANKKIIPGKKMFTDSFIGR